MNQESMNALSHAETRAHMKSFPVTHSAKVLPAKAPMPMRGQGKRMAMDAIANLQTVAQIGLLKLTGGIIAYAGRIREMDRSHTRHPHKGRDATNRD